MIVDKLTPLNTARLCLMDLITLMVKSYGVVVYNVMTFYDCFIHIVGEWVEGFVVMGGMACGSRMINIE